MSTSRKDSSSTPSGTRLKRLSGTKGFRLSVLALGVLTLGGTAASALWADTAATATTITTGTVDIDVDANQGNPAPYVITLPITQFQPGTTTSKTVTLKNSGTLPVTVDLATTNSAGAGGLATGLLGEVTLPGNPGYASAALSSAAFTGRVLAPNETVEVTIKVTAPSNLATTFQGLSDTVTFTFTASQL